MKTAELILSIFLGLTGVVYAIRSSRINFSLTDYLPGMLGNRKTIFIAGFFIVLLGFSLSYAIGNRHEFISLPGGWIMLLGSAPWFNLRSVRSFFAPVEFKVIRTTIFTGLLIALLSTGLFYFPPLFSPGTFLMGIAIAILAGRLWWRQDSMRHYPQAIFNERDCS